MYEFIYFSGRRTKISSLFCHGNEFCLLYL
jgi:hypothetical protein